MDFYILFIWFIFNLKVILFTLLQQHSNKQLRQQNVFEDTVFLFSNNFKKFECYLFL